jgi:hypothetical protein
MKLHQITEGMEQKVADKARKALHGALGDIVADADALFDHIVKGVVNVNQLLLQNERWWETLFQLMQPIQEEILVKAYDATVEHITNLVQQGPVTAAMAEGSLVRGFLQLLKQLAFFIIKAAIAGLAMAGGHHGHGGYRQGNNARRQEQIGYINVITITYFLEQVLPAAEAERDRQTPSKQLALPAPTQPPATLRVTT